MGLDMYLTLERYLSPWDDQEKKVASSLKRRFPELKGLVRGTHVKTVEVEVAYWRKANQIHNWFVNNVQDGKDECQQAHVPIEKLRELLDVCETVLKDKRQAVELLPPTTGFFFGGTEMDEWYWKEIKATVRILRPLVEKLEGGFLPGWHLYYRSSW